MFVRPAMSESQFEQEDDMEWGMSEPEADEPVGMDPADRLIPHLSRSGALPATAQEAWLFWADGGWDEGNE